MSAWHQLSYMINTGTALLPRCPWYFLTPDVNSIPEQRKGQHNRTVPLCSLNASSSWSALSTLTSTLSGPGFGYLVITGRVNAHRFSFCFRMLKHREYVKILVIITKIF